MEEEWLPKKYEQVRIKLGVYRTNKTVVEMRDRRSIGVITTLPASGSNVYYVGFNGDDLNFVFAFLKSELEPVESEDNEGRMVYHNYPDFDVFLSSILNDVNQRVFHAPDLRALILVASYLHHRYQQLRTALIPFAHVWEGWQAYNEGYDAGHSDISDYFAGENVHDEKFIAPLLYEAAKFKEDK